MMRPAYPQRDRSGGEDLGLLSLELGFGQRARAAKLTELGELRQLVRLGRSGRCRLLVRLLRLLLVVGGLLLTVLLGPSTGLSTRHPIRHGGGGSGDDGGSRHATEESWHRDSLLSDRGLVRLGLQRGEDGLDGDTPVGHHLCATSPKGRRERTGPDVFVDQDSCRAVRLDRRTSLFEVFVPQQSG